jgi:hypothetical protein
MALNVDARLKEHNQGKNRFTKGHLPWKIIYTEDHSDWSSARVREKYLKSAAGKFGYEKSFTVVIRVPCLRDAVRQAGNPYALPDCVQAGVQKYLAICGVFLW